MKEKDLIERMNGCLDSNHSQKQEKSFDQWVHWREDKTMDIPSMPMWWNKQDIEPFQFVDQWERFQWMDIDRHVD